MGLEARRVVSAAPMLARTLGSPWRAAAQVPITPWAVGGHTWSPSLRRYFFSQAVITNCPPVTNSNHHSLSDLSALVWAISTTAKALSAYATREVVSRMYRWRCPKRGIGARLHETPLRAARTARRRQKHARTGIPPSALVQRSREGQPRDRARMLGSKHGSSRQNGIAEAASGHVEFTYAPAYP